MQQRFFANNPPDRSLPLQNIRAEPTSLPAGNDIDPLKRLAFHAVGAMQ